VRCLREARELRHNDLHQHHFDCTDQATCSVTTFSFHYSAGDQGLVEHEWDNAWADRGGNHGDIRSTNAP
jgi:hypothetical protein